MAANKCQPDTWDRQNRGRLCIQKEGRQEVQGPTAHLAPALRKVVTFAQEEEAQRKELDAEAAAAEQRFLELQRKAAAAAAAAREEQAKKKAEQAQVLGRNGARTKLSFKLFG